MSIRLISVLLLSVACAAQVRIPGPGGAAAVAGAGTFTLVQSFPTSVGCSGSTTCSMALPGSLGAGHLVTIQCYAINEVTLQSVNVGGTLVPVSSTDSGNTNTLFYSNGYIVSSTSTAGPVVVTFSGNMGAGSTCYGREYSYTSGTPKLDQAHGTLKSGTTSVTGETVATISGSNDVMVQSNNTDYQLTTAVSGTGWANGKFDAANGPGWANKLNSTVTTAPTWTIASGSGNAATNDMAFATDATACNDDAFFDFAVGGTNTNTITTTTLTNSTVGYPTVGTQNGWSLSVSPATGMTYATAAAMGPLHTAIRTCGDGTSHAGGTTLGVKFDLTQTAKIAKFNFMGSGTLASFGFFFQTSITTNSDQMDPAQIFMAGGGGIDFYRVNSGLGIECFGGSVNKNIAVTTLSPNTTVWVTGQLNTAVGGQLTVYETSGWTSLGTASCTASGWTVSDPRIFSFGQNEGGAASSANTFYFSNIRVNAAGTYPLGP